MKKAKVSVGDIYVDVKPPRREWRVSQCRDDSVTLERVDKPTTFRFPSIKELTDRNRYAPKK
jgi:hypothetical protein